MHSLKRDRKRWKVKITLQEEWPCCNPFFILLSRFWACIHTQLACFLSHQTKDLKCAVGHVGYSHLKLHNTCWPGDIFFHLVIYLFFPMVVFFELIDWIMLTLVSCALYRRLCISSETPVGVIGAPEPVFSGSR